MHHSSPEDRKARLETAQKELTAAVEAITTSQQWQDFLSFASKLHKYSAGNRIWLWQQSMLRGWDELGYVAGYRTWLSLGRHVRKGEHGLAVLAPLVYKYDDDNGEERRGVRGFTVEHVFADCQTDGDGDLPERQHPELLTGRGPVGMWDALAKLVAEAGFSLERCPLQPENGTTSFADHVVRVADRLDEAAAVKTLAHELAHVLLHVPERIDYHANRARCEVEAESVAFLVCGELAMPSNAYSFPYVATWANGDSKTVTAVADTALDAAVKILGKLAA